LLGSTDHVFATFEQVAPGEFVEATRITLKEFDDANPDSKVPRTLALEDLDDDGDLDYGLTAPRSAILRGSDRAARRARPR
jgi:hypothetical protein